MLIIGLAGLQGVGKDTVANYLVKRYGFIKFAFSDALYSEVQEAFGLPSQDLLRDRVTKDTARDEMALVNCANPEFVQIAISRIMLLSRITLPEKEIPLSPRQILQWWGTDYRRTQDPEYWTCKAREWIAVVRSAPYPEHRPQFFVEAGTRFENERYWIKNHGGNIWHIHRDGIQDTTGHASARELPVLPGERELWNNDTIPRLHMGVDLLLSTMAQNVRVEPMMSHEDLCREYAAGLAGIDSKTGEENENA